jgi:carbamate kinase
LLKADLLLVATGVTNIFLNYNKPNQKTITKTTYKEMNKYLGEYDFGAGSMEPKLKSALEFVKNTGKTAIITDIKNAYKSLKFKAGTIITK